MKRSSLCLGLLVVSCGDSSGPPAPQPAAFQVIAGAAQVDTVGRELKDMIALRVIATDGSTPVPNYPINWTALDGGQVFGTVIYSGTDGIARQRWTLGTIATTQRLVARALDPESGAVLVDDTVTATAIAGAAVSVTVVPDSLWVRFDSLQTDTVAIELRIVDAYNNAAEPCAIQWTSADSARVLPLGLVAQRNEKPYALFLINFSIGGSAVLLSQTAMCGGADSFKLMYSWN